MKIKENYAAIERTVALVKEKFGADSKIAVMFEKCISNTLQTTIKIKENDTLPLQTGRDVIIVTPTYAWRIPKIVSEWIDKTEFIDGKRIWFVMNCGSEIGNAAIYNRELSEQKKLQYMGTARILQPENYIAMFDAPKAEEARKIVAKAEPDIEKVIAYIRNLN